MSLPTTLGAYRECEDIFERAVADPKGVRVQVGSQEGAINLRSRLHYFRKLDRDANAKTYPTDHPQHGQSLYDDFVVQMYPDEDRDAGRWWLYIQPRSSKILAIEPLSETDDLIEVAPLDGEAHEIHQIEDQSNG